MLNFTYKDLPNIQQYAKDIGASGTYVYVNDAVLYDFCAQCEALVSTTAWTLTRWLTMFSRGRYYSISSENLIYTLITYCGITKDELTFTYKGESRLSLDMTHVIKPLIEVLTERVKSGICDPRSENALVLLLAYQDYKAVKVRAEQCRAKIKKLSNCTYEGWRGPLRTIDFKYGSSETGRFYTKNDSIQNWPLEIVPAISADKGYFLVWCDFDQIDMRVGYHLFLREPGSDVDKVYLAADDKYRAMYEIICKAANQPPNFELFQKYRKAYKKAILSAMYNASLQSLVEDIRNRELATQLFEFFQNNKKYQHYRYLIDKSIQFNVDLTVLDYFGFRREIPVPSLRNGREINDAISKCCNTPVQSTSNSIVINWVEGVLAEFEANGYKRNEDIQAYLIRHDECIFKVSIKALQDLWIFKDCAEIAIDDWDILSLDPHCGVSYKVPDKYLEDCYSNSVLNNAGKMHIRTITAARDTPYRAIDEVIDAYAYSFKSLTEHAIEGYAEQQGITVEQAKQEQWMPERIREQLTLAGKTNPFYLELLTYSDRVVIYSSKLDKYRVVDNLSDVIACAKTVGSNKVNCYSLTINSSVMREDVMFRFRSDAPEKTKRIMQGVRDMGFPREWVRLP